MSQQFIWNTLVRITVGEMTRADHFDYSRDIGAHLEDTPEEFLMFSDDLLVTHAPARIEVCVDGQWKQVDAPLALDIGFATLKLQPHMSIDDVRQLPISLFQGWSEAATNANPVIRNLFLSAINNPPSTPNTSGLPSAPAPSNEAPKPTPRRTKTTGSKAIRKT